VHEGHARPVRTGLRLRKKREDAVPDREGLSRRELIRKGAVVGGHLLWIAPAVQTLTPKALAHALSGDFTCCQCTRAVGQHRAFTNTADDPTACEALCATQTNPSDWVMEAFHRDSTPFSTVGEGNSVECSHPNH
jgi:hypothetical protein